MKGNLQFKRGLKTKLPKSAPSGMPLWCEDTKELYIGTDSGIALINGASNSTSASTEIPITTLATSGTISLKDNSVNRISASGNVTFSLPTVNATAYHQILVQLTMTTVRTVNLGTTHYFNGEAPDLSKAGLYNIFYEYNGTYWTVGSIYKGSS